MSKDPSTANGRPISLESGPKKLLPRSKPTPEKPSLIGPLKETGTLDPRHEQISRRLIHAARTHQLYFHKYDKLSEEQLRMLFIKPSRDADAELVVRLETMTYEELKNRTEYEALSYHVSSSLNAPFLHLVYSGLFSILSDHSSKSQALEISTGWML
jgi:hypothetical protein